MTEHVSASQETMMSVRHSERIFPQPFLSSEKAGWEELTVRAYQKPGEIERWIDPVVPEIALVLQISGTMLLEQRRSNGSWKTQLIRQGDLILKPAGVVTKEVRWKSLSSQPMQTLHLSLNHDLFSRTAQQVTERDPARLTLFGRAGFQDPLLAQIGLTLRREVEHPTAAGKLYVQTAAQMLAVHLLCHYTSEGEPIREPSQGLTSQQVKWVIDYIQAHLCQELSLEVLAEQTDLSPYHFARLFHQTTGEGPHQFVLRQRVERAQRLLKETGAPLAHIAVESGFANQSHFTRIFKRHLGLTPRTYRQRSEI
jgi:AraC family transcriptional regulator